MSAVARFGRALLVPVLSVACGFVVAGIVVALSGADPFGAMLWLFEGAFTQPNALTETLVATIPYIFLGLAVAIGFKAALFNIGAEGQFYLGALAGVWVGFAVHGLPAIVHIPLAIGAGMAGGAAYALIPAVLKARFGAHEVITTIMLNHVALAISDYLIAGPDAAHRGPFADLHASAPKTPPIVAAAQLPVIPGTRLHLGLLLALAAVPVIWYVIERTTVGFQLRAVGLNQTAARAAGISVGWTIVIVMAISGALSGLAGADEVLGVSHYMSPVFSVGYGFDAIAVALVAKSNPWGIVPAAFLFGAMRSGAGYMQLQTQVAGAQVSADLISVVQATVIIFVAAPMLVRWLFRIRERRGALPTALAGQKVTP